MVYKNGRQKACIVYNGEVYNYLDLRDKLVAKGEVMVYKHTGYWGCMDHERDVEHLNSLWNNNNAFWRIW